MNSKRLLENNNLIFNKKIIYLKSIYKIYLICTYVYGIHLSFSIKAIKS